MGEFSMQEAIKAFLDKSRIRTGIQALQIEDIWENLVGKPIARNTEKIQIIGDKLIISTPVAPLRHELIYLREKIKQRVNEALGERVVNEVIIH